MQTHHLRRISGALATCVLLAAGAAQAAKAPKVDICHFDADEGIFKPISVNGNSMSNHIENHGDQLPGIKDPETGLLLDEDCFAVIAPEPDVLARAYIDKNRSGAYEGDTDIDIAWVVDTNDSGVIDTGDTVEFGQYPTSFNPCPDQALACTDVGNFNQDPGILITDANPGTGFVQIDAGPTTQFLFVSVPGSEKFFTNDGAVAGASCDFSDRTAPGGNNQLNVNADCPGEPSTPISAPAGGSNSDDYFLDVDFP